MFFQDAPPDTSGYMIAGYAVLRHQRHLPTSLILRQRNRRGPQALTPSRRCRQSPDDRGGHQQPGRSNWEVTPEVRRWSRVHYNESGSVLRVRVATLRRRKRSSRTACCPAIVLGSQSYLFAMPASAATEYAPRSDRGVSSRWTHSLHVVMANFDDDRVRARRSTTRVRRPWGDPHPVRREYPSITRSSLRATRGGTATRARATTFT
jgi:hypothetical protein